MTMRSATVRQEVALVQAIHLLRAARNLAEQANSPRATAAIRRALNSAEGAQRHMAHRRRRTEEATL